MGHRRIQNGRIRSYQDRKRPREHRPKASGCEGREKPGAPTTWKTLRGLHEPSHLLRRRLGLARPVWSRADTMCNQSPSLSRRRPYRASCRQAKSWCKPQRTAPESRERGACERQCYFKGNQHLNSVISYSRPLCRSSSVVSPGTGV